jgi:hypothetical protein
MISARWNTAGCNATRWNADLVLMAVALGAVALAYAAGAFAIGLALHPPGRQSWSSAEILAVGLYPLGWIGLGWAASEVWLRWRGRKARAS